MLFHSKEAYLQDRNSPNKRGFSGVRRIAKGQNQQHSNVNFGCKTKITVQEC